MRESEFPEFVEFFDGRYTMFGDKIEVPAERYEQFAAFPSTLLQMWRHYGFSGFNDGKVWFCDPVAWAPVVEAWMSDRNLAMGTDRWHAIYRSAFGTLQLWGERTGPSVMINPTVGALYPFDSSDDMESEERRGYAMDSVFMSMTEGVLDAFDEQDRPLFDRALTRVGPVSAQTMYTFAPVTQLGGDRSIETVVSEEAIPHMLLLAGLSG